jgi:hypothetical protein
MSEETTANVVDVVSEPTQVETTEQETQVAESETQNTEQAVDKTENAVPSTEQTKAEKSFTQAELDGIVQKRIERERVAIQREAQNHPGLSFLNELAQQNNVSVEQLVDHWKQQTEQERINELLQNNIPEPLAKEILEGRKFREQVQAQQKQTEAQQKQQQMIGEFTKLYPDLKPADIPDTVWADVVEKGKPLTDAYRAHEVELLRADKAKLEQALQIRDKNAENAGSTPGSVTGMGSVPSDFISKATFDQNKNNRTWLVKNLDTIQKSRSKWKG